MVVRVVGVGVLFRKLRSVNLRVLSFGGVVFMNVWVGGKGLKRERVGRKKRFIQSDVVTKSSDSW